MKKPSERSEIGAWLVDQRRRLSAERGKLVRQQDVVDELTAMGFPIDASYYRGIEGGSKKPGRELVERLADYFGSRPPETKDRPTAEMGELVAAMRDQTAAINELVTFLREQEVARPQTEEARIRALVEALLRGGMLDDPPPRPQPGTPP